MRALRKQKLRNPNFKKPIGHSLTSGTAAARRPDRCRGRRPDRGLGAALVGAAAASAAAGGRPGVSTPQARAKRDAGS